MDENRNREFAELVGICLHEWELEGSHWMQLRAPRWKCKHCSLITENDKERPTNPNYSDAREVLRVMREREDWHDFAKAKLGMNAIQANWAIPQRYILEAWRFFRCRRVWLVGVFCQPIYEIWLYEAVAMGRILAPGFFANEMIRKAYSGAVWCGDSPGYIDPAKEVGPAKERIDARLSTYDEETTLLTGGDFEKNVRQQAKERRMLIKAKLLAESRSPLDPPENGGADDANP